MTKQIKLTIAKGKCTLSTEGFQGDECLKSTEKLKELIGSEEDDRTLTSEFFETAVIEETAKDR